MRREYCITIDTECDKSADWSVQWPYSYHGVGHSVAGILRPIFREYDVRPVYFISPEVVRHRHSANILETEANDGAELATHLHYEFSHVEDAARVHMTHGMQRELSFEREEEAIDRMTSEFRERFHAPRSFRAGRFALSSNTLKILESYTYNVDSSVTPNIMWGNGNVLVDYYGWPQNPYYPDERDNRRPGTMNILEVPVTTGLSIYGKLPPWIVRAARKSTAIWSMQRRIVGKRRKTVMLRPSNRMGSFDIQKALIDERMQGREDVLLVMMFHNIDLVPGCSPYCASDEESAVLTARLEALVRYLAMNGFKSVTLNDIADRYSATRNGDARY